MYETIWKRYENEKKQFWRNGLKKKTVFGNKKKRFHETKKQNGFPRNDTKTVIPFPRETKILHTPDFNVAAVQCWFPFPMCPQAAHNIKVATLKDIGDFRAKCSSVNLLQTLFR